MTYDELLTKLQAIKIADPLIGPCDVLIKRGDEFFIVQTADVEDVELDDEAVEEGTYDEDDPATYTAICVVLRGESWTAE
jgi:hypothetical protein